MRILRLGDKFAALRKTKVKDDKIKQEIKRNHKKGRAGLFKSINNKNDKADSEEAGTNPKDLIGITKPDISLIPGVALVHCSTAMMNGAKKYSPYNWRSKKIQAMIYASAAMRHLASWIDGQENAKDSKVHHLAHAMACSAILLDAIEGGHLNDNRPPKGMTAELIERLTETKK